MTEEEEILKRKQSEKEKPKNAQNTDREPPIDFSHDILAIKKELGIMVRRAGDESESDNDRVYAFMLNKDVEKLKGRKMNYANRNKVYIDTRMKDEEYVKMNHVPQLGLLGNVEEIAQLTHDQSWRVTSKPKGPLHDKRFKRWETGLPEGPSAEEIMYHRRIRETKLLWKQVQADSVPDGSKEAEDEAEARRKRQEEQMKKASMETRLENLKAGKFELTRTKPTRAEFKTSMSDWSKSIYKMGRWKTKYGFPSQIGLDSNKRPSEMTVREEDEYNRYTGEKLDNQYIDKNGDIHRDFTEHMVQLRCSRAEKFLFEDAEKKEKIKREKDLMEKMEQRKKRRAEQAAKEEADRKQAEEEKRMRHEMDKERRTELMIIAAAKIAQDAQDAQDDIARRTSGRKLAWVTPKDPPRTVEDVVDEMLAQEKENARLAEEEANRMLIEAELAFRKTMSGRLQTALDMVNGVKSTLSGPTKEQLEEMEMDRLEAEQMKEEEEAAEASSLKRRVPKHEGVAVGKDRSKAFKSRKGAVKKPKSILGHIKAAIFAPLALMGMKKNPLKKSKIEERKANKERSAMMEKMKADMDKKIVDAIFTARKKQKEAQSTLSLMMEGVNGSEYEKQEFYLPDLLNAARAGDYNKCIDIMEHPNTPVGPNEYDDAAEGVSATYIACMKYILGQESENKADKKNAALIDGQLTAWQKLKRWVAKKQGDSKMEWAVKVLLHKGGDINFVKACRDEDGLGLLHVACERGLPKIVTWLLDKGADPNVLTTKSKRSPLMVAAEHDMMECMLILLRRGAMKKINQQDASGRSCLHWISIDGSPQHAQALMICGAKALRNKMGRTPVEEAKTRGKMEMYEKLLYFKENDDEHIQRLVWLESLQDDMSEVASEPGNNG